LAELPAVVADDDEPHPAAAIITAAVTSAARVLDRLAASMSALFSNRPNI
jgi:hypothetical protein